MEPNARFIDIFVLLILGLIWLGALAYLRLKLSKSPAYLLFFTAFYVYICKVLDYTLFQFQSLIVLKYFLPGLMLNGQPDGKSVNLLPLVALGPADVTTSLLNILLFVPFGFGLPFVSRFGFGWTVAAGVLVSAAIETAQFATGYAAGITFRIADVNDVLFNTAGAAIGYLLFLAFARFYRRFARAWGMGADPISRHIIERPQLR